MLAPEAHIEKLILVECLLSLHGRLSSSLRVLLVQLGRARHNVYGLTGRRQAHLTRRGAQPTRHSRTARHTQAQSLRRQLPRSHHALMVAAPAKRDPILFPLCCIGLRLRRENIRSRLERDKRIRHRSGLSSMRSARRCRRRRSHLRKGLSLRRECRLVGAGRDRAGTPRVRVSRIPIEQHLLVALVRQRRLRDGFGVLYCGIPASSGRSLGMVCSTVRYTHLVHLWHGGSIDPRDTAKDRRSVYRPSETRCRKRRHLVVGG